MNERDSWTEAQVSACLQARLTWRQAEGCARDVVQLLRPEYDRVCAELTTAQARRAQSDRLLEERATEYFTMKTRLTTTETKLDAWKADALALATLRDRIDRCADPDCFVCRDTRAIFAAHDKLVAES